jgi:hypothetical protein
MKLAKTLSRLAVGLSAEAFIASSAPAMAEDLVMWGSGGNAKMVDTLVAMWNEKNLIVRSTSPISRMPKWS